MKGAVFTLSEEAGLVCRMEVDKIKAKYTGECEGEMNNFSSHSSKGELDWNPAKHMNSYGPGR